MRRDNPSNIHPDDDMAHNVLREQQRDAAPSPEEAKQMHRDFLSDEGCRADGCDVTDPDRLNAAMPWTHPCPGVQDPMPGPVVWCDDHVHLRKTMASWKVEQTKAAIRKEFVDALVWFECGMNADAKPHLIEDDRGVQHRAPYSEPSSVIRCPRCSAKVKYIDYLEYPEEWLDE